MKIKTVGVWGEFVGNQDAGKAAALDPTVGWEVGGTRVEGKVGSQGWVVGRKVGKGGRDSENRGG